MSLYTIVIHGGAGTILRKDMTPEQEALYVEALQQALRAGFIILESGGTAVDAVTAATVAMEDHILFAAFDDNGNILQPEQCHRMFSLEAAIMDTPLKVTTLGRSKLTTPRPF